VHFLDSLWQDIRYSIRTFKKSPAFAAVVVLSLGLGIGANTAIFSLLNAVLLKTLPVREPAQLVRLNQGDRPWSWTNPIWEQVRDQQRTLHGVLAYGTTRFNLAEGGETRFVQGILASGSFFQVLGIPAHIGRTFAALDDRRGCGDGAPAVLSYGFWQGHFGGAATVLGQTIRLDGHPFTICGVTHPSFFGLEVGRSFDVALPLCAEATVRGIESALDRRTYWWLTIVGRLRPGSTIAQAEASLRSLQPAVREATLPQDIPPEYQASYLTDLFTLQASGTGSSIFRSYRQALYVLMAVVAIVLLVACANIANLMLARAAARAREIAVRSSLGASRRRLVRQLLVESVLLGIMGAAAGILIARWLSRLLVYQISTATSRVFLDLALDRNVLGFTAAVGILTGVLFGILPALRATSPRPGVTLRESQRGGGGHRAGAERWLVSIQVALSLMLVFGAVLFVRSYSALTSLNLGFNRSNVWIVTAEVRRASPVAEQRLPLYDRINETVREIPGVRSAAFSVVTPISGTTWQLQVQVDGYKPRTERDSGVYYNFVSPEYFGALGTPLIAGRDFNDRDTATSTKVAIINESMAHKFYSGRNPIGLTYRTRMGSEAWEPIEIVGVVRDAKYRSLRDPVPATAYCPITQLTPRRLGPSVSFTVKASGDPATLRSSIVQRVSEIKRDIALTFRSLESQVSDSLVQERLMATLSALFGVLALSVAAVGLAGLVSYSVMRRQAEIGIRAALGATGGSLVRLVLLDVLWLTLIGFVAGTAGSLAAGRLVAALLYGLTPADASALVSAAAILGLVSVVAGYVPARRAARIDPMDCLRAE
jgi:predicted permease